MDTRLPLPPPNQTGGQTNTALTPARLGQMLCSVGPRLAEAGIVRSEILDQSKQALDPQQSQHWGPYL